MVETSCRRMNFFHPASFIRVRKNAESRSPASRRESLSASNSLFGVLSCTERTLVGTYQGDLADGHGVTGKVTGATDLSGTHRRPPVIVNRAVPAAGSNWLPEPATECY